MAILGVGSGGFALVFLAVVLVSVQPSGGAVHTVGESAGWTTLGNFNYTQWAATKTFHIGDVIVFKYHTQFHNVMQVTHVDFRACNASSPITTHTSGNDSITITTQGHHFFLCGTPGHCQAGQKVDINVLLSATPSPSPSPAPAAVAEAEVPSPSPSFAAPLGGFNRLFAMFMIAVALVSVSVWG